MPRFNQLTIIGHLGQDAEVRVTGSGDSITGFSVAVSAFKKDQPSQWFRCSWWGDRGVKVAQFMRKGDPILVVGEVGLREYQDKSGATKSSLEVRVSDVQLLGSRNGNSDMQQQAAPRPRSQRVDDDFPPF